MDVIVIVLLACCWCVASTLVCILAGEIAAGFQLLASALFQLCDVVSIVRSALQHWFPAPDWRDQLFAEHRFTIE